MTGLLKKRCAYLNAKAPGRKGATVSSRGVFIAISSIAGTMGARFPLSPRERVKRKNGAVSTPVFPAKAGIQKRCGKERNRLAMFLDSGLRRKTGVDRGMSKVIPVSRRFRRKDGG